MVQNIIALPLHLGDNERLFTRYQCSDIVWLSAPAGIKGGSIQNNALLIRLHGCDVRGKIPDIAIDVTD